jgi:uncharacterized protein
MAEIIKAKHFTDSDLDGYGCGTISDFHFDDVDIVNVNPYNVDEKVSEFLQSGDAAQYDYVFITDVSVNEENAKLIESINEHTDIRIVLIDHHATALWLNKYPWATVKVEHEPGKLASGTTLFLEYLKTEWAMKKSTRLEVFAEMVRKYDTWEWENVYKDIQPKRLNDLFYIYGGKRFMQHISLYLKRILSGIFNEEENLVLELERERIDAYIKQKRRGLVMVHRPIDGYNLAIVHADKYHSEIGHVFAKENEEIDIVAIVDMNQQKVSFRTIKDSVDVGAFARKYYNGGGHAAASGGTINHLAVSNFLKVAFEG